MTDLLTDLRAAGIEDWLVAAVGELSRGSRGEAEAFLASIGEPVALADTRTTCRTHFIRKDANGRVRLDTLVDYLAQRVVDFCIPRTRINEAAAKFVATGSAAAFTRLAEEARRLFTPLEKSGEGGELLLYTMLETVLGIPQILCKMPLKTNSGLHVNGTDGIHAEVLADGNLALYWGESKVYKDASAAVDACLESVAPYLTGGIDEAANRDLHLIRQHLDTGVEAVTVALLEYFVEESPRGANVEVRAGCLVGFDIDDYPDPSDDLADEVRDVLVKFHDRVGAQVVKYELAEFQIEVFCVPFPSVEDFRLALRKKLGLA